MATQRPQANMDGVRRQRLEHLVELLSAFSTHVLVVKQLNAATEGRLTPAQLEAMTFIERHGGCSAKALSEGLHISIPSSTRLVDRLVRKGLVDRRESGEDRRLVHLSVTEAGQQQLQDVQQARINCLGQVLEQFTPEDREALLTLLERFLRAALSDAETVEECCLHCGTQHFPGCVINEAHLALAGEPIAHP